MLLISRFDKPFDRRYAGIYLLEHTERPAGPYLMKIPRTNLKVFAATLAAGIMFFAGAREAGTLMLYQKTISNSFSITGFLPDSFQYSWGYTTGEQFVAPTPITRATLSSSSCWI